MNLFKKDPVITERLYLEWPIYDGNILEFKKGKEVIYKIVLFFTSDKNRNDKRNSVSHPDNKAIVGRLMRQVREKTSHIKNSVVDIVGIYDIRSDSNYDYLVDDANSHYLFNNIILHGSPTSGLDTIETRPNHLLAGESVVYGGSYWAALTFLIDWNDSELDLGVVNGKPYLRELKPGTLNKLESAKGSLYYLDSTYFVTDKKIASFEMISHIDEKVLEEIEIENPLRLMREAGVKIITYANRSREF